MRENRSWDKSLLVKCNYHEAKSAGKYARPERERERERERETERGWVLLYWVLRAS